MSRPQPQPQLNFRAPQLVPQRPTPQPQMCQLRYNYCECKGCAKDFAKFQKRVQEKYKIPKPSLDEKHRTITVIGTSDAAGLRKLLLENTRGKKHVEILPNPKKETSEGANHPAAPPQPPREATTMREKKRPA
uniref:uncharacterized protein LOC105351091 n=1 Tax=Fragaria vesca subsp. vesca TaxID=101020 RepID=UPI0005C8DCE4|nr:PREDICTED: uncharacterized protein LOC105351091 [Fragaria vesca subsp. vesca]